MKTKATEMSPIGKSEIVIDTENTLGTGNEKAYDLSKGSENANDSATGSKEANYLTTSSEKANYSEMGIFINISNLSY